MYAKISVVIPTYNRANLLFKTINSFINQSLVKDKYEIIIVDNNSSDTTKKLVEEIIQKNKELNIKYVFEKRVGVHYARNRGAREAKNEILYFTDDDMLANKNLLEEILKVFDIDYSVGTAAGIILPKFEINPPDWILKNCYNSILSLNPKKEIELIISSQDIGVFSCHQAIKKRVLFEAGGFNPENVRGKWVGDGETGLNKNIKKLGYKFAFTSKSVIYHLIPKERLTQKYINKRLANQGNADSYSFYRENKPSKKQLYFQILKHIFKAIYFLKLAIIFFLIGNSEWHLRLAHIFYWLARIKYDSKLIRSAKWREFVLKSNWIEE